MNRVSVNFFHRKQEKLTIVKIEVDIENVEENTVNLKVDFYVDLKEMLKDQKS